VVILRYPIGDTKHSGTVESGLLSQVKSCGVVAFELGTWWKASVSESVSPVLKT
jgi:hypothetical protein